MRYFCFGGGPVRIIAGEARGRRLDTLPGEDTRPTLERVKEGVFSAVQFWLPGAKVLDLFSGSGQLGLEALSRGAASCTFVEQNPRAVALIQKNAQAVELMDRSRVVRGDADSFLARCADKYDLILMDPPFEGGHYPGILKRVAAVCGPGALVLCESAAETAFPERAGALRLEKQYRYGTVLVSRYKMEEESEA